MRELAPRVSLRAQLGHCVFFLYRTATRSFARQALLDVTSDSRRAPTPRGALICAQRVMIEAPSQAPLLGEPGFAGTRKLSSIAGRTHRKFYLPWKFSWTTPWA